MNIMKIYELGLFNGAFWKPALLGVDFMNMRETQTS